MIFSLLFPQNRILQFTQTVSIAWKIKNLFSEEEKSNIKYFNLSFAENFIQPAKH